MGALGMWIGLDVAICVQAASVTVVLISINWTKESLKARQRSAEGTLDTESVVQQVELREYSLLTAVEDQVQSVDGQKTSITLSQGDNSDDDGDDDEDSMNDDSSKVLLLHANTTNEDNIHVSTTTTREDDIPHEDNIATITHEDDIPTTNEDDIASSRLLRPTEDDVTEPHRLQGNGEPQHHTTCTDGDSMVTQNGSSTISWRMLLSTTSSLKQRQIICQVSVVSVAVLCLLGSGISSAIIHVPDSLINGNYSECSNDTSY